MAAHIASENAQMTGQQWHPMLPETKIATETVLDPNRLGLLPWRREVVELVVHRAIVRCDFRHQGPLSQNRLATIEFSLNAARIIRNLR
jgi:hypothetical protein